MIYHVTTLSHWKQSLTLGFHEAESLATEGFIHASDSHQVKGVLERYYKNKTDLLLLHIDETKLTSVLKYELAPSVNELFPHIYGSINTDAVMETSSI
jgi:uncharacterized protein (DUF952 family)